jgi:gamma-glutamylcyclotransferase (GGCT)/AIG2-like uncharacterized protein YtfP
MVNDYDYWNSASREPSRLYFAYGSNLNTERLAKRCGYVEKVKTVVLPHYRLAFNTGNDLRSFANIVPSKRDVIEGVVYRISQYQEDQLDVYEGVSMGNYSKQYIRIDNDLVLCYFGEKPSTYNPDLDYLRIIHAGAKEHNLKRTKRIVEDLYETIISQYKNKIKYI